MYKYIKLNIILAKICIDYTMFAYVLLNYIVVIDTMMWLNRKLFVNVYIVLHCILDKYPTPKCGTTCWKWEHMVK
jgi:hypothetical protein